MNRKNFRMLNPNKKQTHGIFSALLMVVITCVLFMGSISVAQTLEQLDVKMENLIVLEDISDLSADLPFSVRVTNYETSITVQYRVVFSLTVTNSPVVNGEVLFGYTRVGTEEYDELFGDGVLGPGESDVISGIDNRDKIGYLWIDPEFNNVIARPGRLPVLPAGDYTFTFSLQTDTYGDGDELYFVDPRDTPYTQVLSETRRVIVPDPPLLSLPIHQSIEAQTNPTFSWYSIEVSPGVGVYYNIRICLREEGQSDEEAIENLAYWTNNWGGLNIYGDEPVVLDQTGQISITWNYPPEADPLVPGREFVWQVTAYDVDGLFGWDDVNPLESEIWSFQFGVPPELLTPSDGMVDVGTVRPTFTWTTVTGAMNYEIWFGDREDPTVDLPFWDAVVSDPNYTYPVDAPALIPVPSYLYYWKVRPNPLEPIPGSWSDQVFQFSIIPIDPIIPSDGSSVPTILPTFSWTSPADLGGFEFRISDEDDDQVESPIYSQILTMTSYTYAMDATPLTPGKTFKWKVLALDQNENVLGEIEDYLTVRSFSVEPISLTSPSDGTMVTTVAPLFSWDAPLGIPYYEFQLSNGEDPLVENPIFTQIITTPSYQFSSTEITLIPGKTYYWKIIALDADEMTIGTVEDYQQVFSFTVQSLDLTTPSDGSIESTCRPYFNWSAFPGLNSFEFRLGASDDHEIESPIFTYQVSGKSFTYPGDADVLLCCGTGGPYYWMVIPLNEEGNPIGEPESYPKMSFSIKPIELVTPENGDVLSTLIPNFSWDPPQYLSDVFIKFFDVEGPIVSVHVTGTSFIPLENEAGFGPGREYYWTVVAADNSGSECGVISNSRSFSFPGIALISPDASEITDNACPQFSWESLTGIPGYQIVINDEDETEIFSETVNNPPFTLPISLGPGNTYSWKVQAVNSDGEIIGEPPAEGPRSLSIQPIELLTPVDNEQVSSLMPVFQWETPSCVDEYKIIVTRTTDGQVIFEQEEIQGISFTYPIDAEPLSWETTYQWTIQAIADGGEIGKESTPGVFVTPLQPSIPPPIITDITFVAGGPADQPRPIVSVNLATGTDHYTITFTWDAEITDVFHQEEGLTVLQYEYPEDATGIPWESSFYIQVSAFNENDEPHGIPTNLSDVYSAVSPENPILPASILTVNVPDHAPILPSFSWSNVVGAENYRLIVSTEEETDANGILGTGFFDSYISGTNYSWSADDPPLNYVTQYFAQIIGYANEEQLSEPSSVIGFVTGQQPGVSDKPVISVIIEGPDPRIPTIYLTTQVSGADNYYLAFSENEDMSEPWFIPGITSFPYVYPSDAPALNYNTDYYVMAQCYVGDTPHGMNSDIVSFTTGEEPGANEQPIVTIAFPESPLLPVFELSSPVTGATAYQITIALSEDMSDVIWVSDLITFPFTYTNDPALDFNTTYYIQVQGFKDDNPHGLISIVIQLTTGIEPGADERPEISISFGSDPLLPIFNLVTPVTGADAYQLLIANDPETADPFWISGNITPGSFPFTYPSTAQSLQFGSIYYSSAIAIKNGSIHGLPGTVILIQIPSITKPVLLDAPLFSWRGTDPASAQYEIKVSPLEDMSALVWSEVVSATSISQPEDVFDWGTTYYWQVQGLDSEGNPFGGPSNVGFFSTPAVEPPNLISPVNEQVSTLYPTFSWTVVLQASQYEINVGEDEDLTSILWNELTSETSVIYPHDALNLVRGRSYYWQVTPLDAEGAPFGAEANSAIVSFQTPELIQPPDLIYPVGEQVTTLTPTFSWTSVGEAAQYEISVGENEDLSSVLWSEVTSETNISYSEEALKLGYGATYYWQIVPLNGEGTPFEEARSVVASFQTPSIQPPELVEPVNVAVTSLTPTFTWTGVEGAAAYRIEISATEDFAEILLTTDITTTEYTYAGPPDLSFERTYYWRIQALDQEGNQYGDPSVIASLTTPSIDEITLYFPVDVVVSSLTPVFSWATLEAATAYRITVSQADAIIWSTDVEAGEITYPGEPSLEYETTYTWNVQPLDNESNPISNNPQATFSTPSAIQPVLTSPVDVQVSTLTPLLVWEGVEGEAGYKVELSANEDMSDAWSTTIGLTSVSYPGDPPLEYEHTYYWRVITLNTEGEEMGEWSSIASFTTQTLVQVNLIAPVGEISTLTPSFTWQEVQGAAGYKIELSANEDVSDPWSVTVGLTSVQYSGDPPLEFDISYYWRVIAVDQDGNAIGDWSITATFQITTIFIVNLVYPVNQEVFSLNPAFNWEAVETAEKYEITISSEEDFSEILWSVAELQEISTQYPAIGVTQLAFEVTYYWHVRALDNEGNPLGDPSSAASFTVSMALIPELITPIEIQVETLNPVFSWSEVSGAAKYAIWVSSSDEFSEIVYQNLNVEMTGITYPVSGAVALEFEQTYYWRVQALSEEGEALGDPSPASFFITPTAEMEIIVDYGP